MVAKFRHLTEVTEEEYKHALIYTWEVFKKISGKYDIGCRIKKIMNYLPIVENDREEWVRISHTLRKSEGEI